MRKTLFLLGLSIIAACPLTAGAEDSSAAASAAAPPAEAALAAPAAPQKPVLMAYA